MNTTVEGWYWARGAYWLDDPTSWAPVHVRENCGEWVAYQGQSRMRLDADPALQLRGPLDEPKD